MREETLEQARPLRHGYSTGAYATAASLAAAQLLLTGTALDRGTITLPKGQRVEFQLEYRHSSWSRSYGWYHVKDAGDDPDVTHGALLFAQVELLSDPNVHFQAGPGVGDGNSQRPQPGCRRTGYQSSAATKDHRLYRQHQRANHA